MLFSLITLVFSSYNVWISNDRVHENRGFMVKQVFNSQNTFLLYSQNSMQGYS